MKSYILALVALITFGIYYPCQGQQRATEVPKATDNTGQDTKPQAEIAPASPSADSVASTKATGVVIEKDKHSKSVTVTSIPLTVKGHIEGDIDASDSTITIEKTGTVSGVIRLSKGTLINHSETPVSVVNAKSHASDSNSTSSGVVHISGANSFVTASSSSSSNWFTQQLALLILGVMCGAVLCTTAPVATRKVSNAVALEPARCLIIGGAVALGLGMITVLNANLLSHSMRLFSLVWSPFGFGLSVLVLGVLAFSWVCGLRHLGNYIASRTGNQSDGTLFGRLALGMAALFLVSLVVGSLLTPLAVLGLLLQGLLTVMGLGATLITGFGREANWLGGRMNRGPNFGKG